MEGSAKESGRGRGGGEAKRVVKGVGRGRRLGEWWSCESAIRWVCGEPGRRRSAELDLDFAEVERGEGGATLALKSYSPGFWVVNSSE